MWILHWLPDAVILWFCNILLIVGIALTVAGFFAHRIPVIWQYQLPFKIAGAVLLSLGVYFRGGYAVEAEWRERVAEVEARVAEAEQQSKSANSEINKKSTEKTNTIKTREVVVKQYIDREVVKYNDQCVIPQPFVRAHNDAAEAPRK